MKLRNWLLVPLFVLAGTLAVAAPEPAWWSSGVADTNPANPPDNWAMANIGQLKNIATKARAHLDGVLGTTQSDWNAAYAPDACPLPFSTTSDPDNFSPVTAGQLKFVASGFYRLLQSKAPTYDVRGRLQALGVPAGSISGSGPYFPWSTIVPTGENFSPITIGQLKLVFAFDLASPANTSDVDQDGIPDWWESAHGLNPNNAADAQSATSGGLSNLLEYRLGTNPATAKQSDTGDLTQLKVHRPFD